MSLLLYFLNLWIYFYEKHMKQAWCLEQKLVVFSKSKSIFDLCQKQENILIFISKHKF